MSSRKRERADGKTSNLKEGLKINKVGVSLSELGSGDTLTASVGGRRKREAFPLMCSCNRARGWGAKARKVRVG